jgi:peroxiredoxin
MIELGQLEQRHQDFAHRNVRILAASVDPVADARKTQDKFPHLVILSDADHHLSNAAQVLGPQKSPDGKTVDSPTTVLIDRTGLVRWVYRSDNYITRLSPDELLAAIDQHVKK